MNLGDFDLEKYQKETGTEFKIIFDVFTSYLLHIYENKDRDKHLDNLTPDQTLQTIDWLSKHAIPFYEEVEEFEKCSRLKKVIDFIKESKA